MFLSIKLKTNILEAYTHIQQNEKEHYKSEITKEYKVTDRMYSNSWPAEEEPSNF